MNSIYDFVFDKKAKKFLKKQDKVTQKRLLAAILKLPEGDIKKLKGTKLEIYRLRVGDFRILFNKDEGKLVIIVIDINNRGQIYK